MLAHFGESLHQLLQTLSDRYALHRDGALSLGVVAEWCWDMDFHSFYYAGDTPRDSGFAFSSCDELRSSAVE